MVFIRTKDVILIKNAELAEKTLKKHKNTKKVIAINEFDDYYNKFGCKAL